MDENEPTGPPGLGCTIGVVLGVLIWLAIAGLIHWV